MMSNGFIYIRNAEDDAYVNHGDNFRGMEQAASGAVILYFESPISTTTETGGAYDKITLAVTANKEKDVVYYDKHAGHSIQHKDILYQVIRSGDVVLID